MQCRLRAARALIQGEGQVPELLRSACLSQALGLRHVQLEQGQVWALEPVKLRIVSGYQLRRMPRLNGKWKLVNGNYQLPITNYQFVGWANIFCPC